MPVQKIGDLIANSGNLHALTQKARQLKDLQQRLFEAAPPSLAAASRVADLRSGTLIIVSDNAAVAAKLRQLAPRLLSHVQEQAAEVTGMRVDVQVKVHKIKAEDEAAPRALPSDAIQEIEQLSKKLPPSPLQAALARFAARRRGKPV